MELVNHRTGLAKKESQDLVETVFLIIKEGLSEGERVKISGFGAFVVNHKQARRGRNPHTGAPMQIGPHRVLSFKPSRTLKELVNSERN